MYLLKFSTGQFVRGAIMQAANHTKGNFSRGQFPEGYCLGTIIFVVIFQEKQSGSNYSGGKYLGEGDFPLGQLSSRGNCPGAIIFGSSCPGKLSGEQLPPGVIVLGVIIRRGQLSRHPQSLSRNMFLIIRLLRFHSFYKLKTK